MLCGLSGSGKSTLAEDLLKRYESRVTYIASDKIREELCGNENDQSKNRRDSRYRARRNNRS